MRKILSVLVLLLSLSMLSAADIRIAAMRGPTAMGLASLMEKAEDGPVDGISYSFVLEGSPDAVVPKIVRGDVDVAAIPGNLASVLYNRTGGRIGVIGINTLGVLYIAENGNTIGDIQDLMGKTIYSAGKGATPEYSLMYILSESGLVPGRDVFIEWKSEHAECVAAIAADSASAAMLPQPFATTAMMKNSDIRLALDVNAIWEELTGVGMITGVTVVRKEFAEEHPDILRSFMEEYEESVRSVDAGTVAKAGIIPEPVAEKAIPYCNIVLITGDEMKTALSFYLSVLEAANASAIGGKAPGDDFYL